MACRLLGTTDTPSNPETTGRRLAAIQIERCAQTLRSCLDRRVRCCRQSRALRLALDENDVMTPDPAPRRPSTTVLPPEGPGLRALTSLITGVVVICALYFGRAV